MLLDLTKTLSLGILLGAVTLVGQSSQPDPFLSSQARWVRLNAWICDVSSTDSTRLGLGLR